MPKLQKEMQSVNIPNPQTEITYTDDWVRNDFMDSHKDIIIEVNNVIKLKNKLGEAFWVDVTEILPNNKYVGQVNNHLVLNSPYNYDDLVLFAKEDIRDYKNEQIQMQQYAMVNEIVQITREILGRTPTLEEMDFLFTKITNKS